MKSIKLLTLAIACMLGMSASAASICWNVSRGAFTDQTGSSFAANAATVYLFIGTTEDAAATYNAYVAAKGITNAEDVISSATIGDLGYVDQVTVTNDSFTADQVYSFYAVVVYTDSDGQEWALVSTGAESSTASASGDITLSNTARFVRTDFTDSVWVAVPEPTCLALLALGVAGLALRRRVA